MVTLYPSQQAILDEVKDKNRVSFYLGVGSGKTWIGGEKLMSFGTSWNLIVCQRSQVEYWVNHFHTHYPEVTVTDLTKIAKMSLGHLRPGVMVINYELAFRRELLLTLRNFSLMLDESSLIQNMQAKRTKFILKLKPDNVVLLSGTPVSGGQLDKDEGLIYGRYENLISQLHLLGWKISKKSFWERYVNWELRQYGEVRVQEVVSYKNIKELNSMLKTLGCVFRRTEDIVELPDFDEQTIYVSKIPAYNKMQRNGIVQIDDEELIGDLPMTKWLRLRQICAHHTKEKASVLADLLESLENERVVIFYTFIPELEVIKNVVGDSRPFYQINGQVKDWDEKAWNSPENSNAVVACQYNSGSRGHNMQAACHTIYMSVTDRAEYFDQSRGRIRRNGQKADRVMYYHIVCKGTVEEKQLASVRAGVDYTLEDYERDYS